MLGGAAKAKSKGILIWQSGDEVVAVNYMWSGDRRHSPTPFGRQPFGGPGLWLCGRVLGLWGLFFGVKQLLLRGIHCPAGGPGWSLRA